VENIVTEEFNIENLLNESCGNNEVEVNESDDGNSDIK
jgi:hypothetical protein